MKTGTMLFRTFKVILVCSSCWMPTVEQAVVSGPSLHSTKDALVSVADSLLLEEKERMFPGDYLTPYRYATPRGSHVHARGRREAEGDDACEPMVQGEDLDVEVGHMSRSPAAGIEWKRFAEDVEFERTILGSLVFVDNPLHTVSLVEPYTKGSCAGSWGAVRSRVTETVQRRKHGCKVALNAGFFVPFSGKCLGNIVADGTVVQTAGNIRNANFGLRDDGTFVTGYLSDQEVKSAVNPFKQVVSGVVWLVRNSTSFVNQSLGEECANNEETGSMKGFAEVVSARSAVGHDKDGRLVLAKVEGETWKRGANLYEFADLLIRHGVMNAINLDGGGSSQLVMGDTLVSYPSDRCSLSLPDYRCEREVSTIFCVHDIECIDDCNEHGECVGGNCTCRPPWAGPSCGTLNCNATNCSGRGECSEGKCHCSAGWKGHFCDQQCDSDHFGPGCTIFCYCAWKKHSHCNKDGACVCDAGWKGFLCDTQCEEGYFGPDCKERCSLNCTHGQCSPVNGLCVCQEGWSGQDCSIAIANLNSTLSLDSGSGNRSNVTVSQNSVLHNATSIHSQSSPDPPTSPLPKPSPLDSETTALLNSTAVCDCSKYGRSPSVSMATSTPEPAICSSGMDMGNLLPRDVLIALVVSIPLGTLLLHAAMCVGCYLVSCRARGRKKHKSVRTQRERNYYTRLKIQETDSDRA